jgi:hypothetical protein
MGIKVFDSANLKSRAQGRVKIFGKRAELCRLSRLVTNGANGRIILLHGLREVLSQYLSGRARLDH